MTLWAVQVVGAPGYGTYFPSPTRNDAVESAARINDWVAHMRREHPADAPDITAEVIEWPRTSGAHSFELAKVAAFVMEEDEEI